MINEVLGKNNIKRGSDKECGGNFPRFDYKTLYTYQRFTKPALYA